MSVCMNASYESLQNTLSLSLFEEQISAPVMTVEPVSCDGDLCNVTVTCRAEDLYLTSTCNNSYCTQKERTAAFSSLNICIKNGAIVCNHSNPIGCKYVTVEIDTVLSEGEEY